MHLVSYMRRNAKILIFKLRRDVEKRENRKVLKKYLSTS